jgi:small membrane protein
MKIVLIQLVLIVVVVVIAARLLRGRGARTQAVRRLGMLLFAAFAVWSILFPSVWNRIAKLVGVGRGTDMVLYALVVAFLSFTLTTYVRFRDFEARYTKLARRQALDEAGPPPDAAAGRQQSKEPYAGP